MYVNTKIFYHGTCPTKEYLSILEKKLGMRFVKVELQPISANTFVFSSSCISDIVNPGNPELSAENTLYISSIDYEESIDKEWIVYLPEGTHAIRCEHGNYQVFTYTSPLVISRIFRKVFGIIVVLTEDSV